jgi:hypothetical protein
MHKCTQLSYLHWPIMSQKYVLYYILCLGGAQFEFWLGHWPFWPRVYVGFEVFTAVVMKSIIFWGMMPCSPLSCTWRFRGMYSACHLLTRWFAELFFDPEDGGDMFLWNVGCNAMDYTASYRRRWYSSRVLWFSSVPSGRCQDSIKKLGHTSFHILSWVPDRVIPVI